MAYDNITQIDALEHDTTQGTHSSVVMIDATHFIVAYSSSGDNGYIKTFSIDTDGDNIAQIDSLEYDTAKAWENRLVKIDATHFALTFHNGSSSFIKTFSIDGSYDNIAEIDSLTHSTYVSYGPSLTLVDSTHLILVYEEGTVTDGYIKTFSFDGSYDNIAEIDQHTFDTAHGVDNSVVKIDATHYIFATAGSAFDGYIYTIVLDGSYIISEIDSLEHDTDQARWNSLVMLDSTHFILSYKGLDNDGYIKTFSIDGSYDNIAEIDVLEHDIVGGAYGDLTIIDSKHVILAYAAGTGYVGTVKTFSVDDSFDTITEIDDLAHTTGYGYYNSIDEMKSGLYVVAFTGEGATNDGNIKTFSIDLDLPGGIKEVNYVAIADIDTIDEIAIGDILAINEINK